MQLEALVEAAGRLAPAGEEAARAFRAAGDELVARVDRVLLAAPGLAGLIGGHPFNVVTDNHRHHAAIVATSLELGDHALFVRSVAWAYASYSARGFDPEYFRVELEGWREALAEQLEPAHARAIDPLYAFVLEHHEDFVRVAAESPAASSSLEALEDDDELRRRRERFLTALLGGDHERALALVAPRISDAATVGRAIADVVAPAMVQVGERWQRGRISIAEEHLATSIAGRVMAELFRRAERAASSRGMALVALAPGETHEAGARAIADVLELDGWQVRVLPAPTSVRAIAEAVARERPFLVALSVTMGYSLAAAREAIAALREDPCSASTPVLVGGQAFAEDAERARRIGADLLASDAADALVKASALWDASGVR